MMTQRFKTIVTRTGSRTYIAIPFNPNEVWGVKQRHHITGSINGCAVRGSLGSDGSQYFVPLDVAWRRDNGVEAGAEVDVVLTPEGPQADALAADIVAALDSEPEAKPSSSRWQPSIAMAIFAGSRVPNAQRRAAHASPRCSGCSKRARSSVE